MTVRPAQPGRGRSGRGSKTTTAVSCGRRAAYPSRFLSSSRQRCHSRSRSSPHALFRAPRVEPIGHLDDGLRVGLQVQPPGGLGRTPAAHRHRDQVGTVLVVADDDAPGLSAASTHGGESQGAPLPRTRGPQPPCAAQWPGRSTGARARRSRRTTAVVGAPYCPPWLLLSRGRQPGPRSPVRAGSLDPEPPRRSTTAGGPCACPSNRAGEATEVFEDRLEGADHLLAAERRSKAEVDPRAVRRRSHRVARILLTRLPHPATIDGSRVVWGGRDPWTPEQQTRGPRSGRS